MKQHGLWGLYSCRLVKVFMLINIPHQKHLQWACEHWNRSLYEWKILPNPMHFIFFGISWLAEYICITILRKCWYQDVLEENKMVEHFAQHHWLLGKPILHWQSTLLDGINCTGMVSGIWFHCSASKPPGSQFYWALMWCFRPTNLFCRTSIII